MLAGTVVDARTHQPIEQAAVDIYNDHDHSKITSGHTDASGRFETPPVPPGTYTVGARRNGYAIWAQEHFEMHPGATQIDVVLNPK